ncbi:MAG: hypothetical protein E7620_00100 [Ruminococcaceae bacterium]|nr:hypothetical protein [Oscillospiraceae bacterium]
MKRRDQHRADRLLDAIGGINDSFLDEALNYRTARPPIRHTLRNWIAVAAVAAILLFAVTGPLSRILKTDTPNAPTQEQPQEGTKLPTSAPTLSALLEGCAESPSFAKSAADELNFFDGNVRLTVENRSSGELFVSRPLTAAEQSTLAREFRANGKQVAANASPEEYRVWVMLGDGSVVTPCLNPTVGNVGGAVLFDYESERVPTDLFLDLLSDLT